MTVLRHHTVNHNNPRDQSGNMSKPFKTLRNLFRRRKGLPPVEPKDEEPKIPAYRLPGNDGWPQEQTPQQPQEQAPHHPQDSNPYPAPESNPYPAPSAPQAITAVQLLQAVDTPTAIGLVDLSKTLVELCAVVANNREQIFADAATMQRLQWINQQFLPLSKILGKNDFCPAVYEIMSAATELDMIH